MLVGTLAGTGEVLSPVQLLWINLLTDILPGLALALEPPEQDVLKQPPRDPAEAIIRPQDAWTMLRESLLLTGGALAAYGITLNQGGTQAKAGGNAFMTLTLGQLLHALSCRSETTGLFNPQGRPANPALNYALAASALLQLLAALLPALRTVLGLSPMTARDWLAVSLGAGTPFLCNEGLKLLHPSTQPQREPA
jgi:Ca2+-transporting ATPase